MKRLIVLNSNITYHRAQMTLWVRSTSFRTSSLQQGKHLDAIPTYTYKAIYYFTTSRGLKTVVLQR